MQRSLLLVALAMVPGSAWAAEADRSMPDYRIGQWTGTVDVVDVGSAPVQMDSRWGFGKVLMIDTLAIQKCIEGWTSHARVTILDPKSGDLSRQVISDLKGSRIWACGEGGANGHALEQADMIAALRSGKTPPNEAEYAAVSNMTAIMARMATCSGQVITRDQAIACETSRADVGAIRDFGAPAPVQPGKDGRCPIPVPGITKPF